MGTRKEKNQTGAPRLKTKTLAKLKCKNAKMQRKPVSVSIKQKKKLGLALKHLRPANQRSLTKMVKSQTKKVKSPTRMVQSQPGVPRLKTRMHVRLKWKNAKPAKVQIKQKKKWELV